MPAPKHRLNYVELSIADGPSARAFYEAVLGWEFADFGASYSATITDDTDIGLDASTSAPPLPVIESEDIESSFHRAKDAGAVITRPIFEFPGGRRFHFTDPDGNELAIWQRK